MEAKNIQEKEDEENFDILIKSDILKTNLGS